MSEKETREYRFTLKLKDCDMVFKEGFGEGELLYQDYEYTHKPEKLDSPQFLMSLIGEEEDFIKRHVEVIVKRIK